jgi:1-aminocyclopropane-1-carboxylate deaminase
MFGMELRFVDRESYRDKQKLFAENYGNDLRAFFIDEGGASDEAAKGCAELIDELEEEYSHIFCASGTGTTAAGILNGITNHRLQTQLHTVPVLKNASFIEEEIGKYLLRPAKFILHLDYHFGGYAKTNPELLSFMQAFSSSTGILLDPVYTGKLVYAVFDLVKKDAFKSGDKILIIHSGGLVGLLGKI